MRILIDVQTLYTDERNRGIGVYTYNWLKTFVQHDDSKRYFLMRKKDNVWQFTFVSKQIQFDNRLDQDQFWEESDVEQFITDNRIDIVHFTSPLMFDIEVPIIKNNKVKKSFLIYDLIPIVMKEQYYDKWPKQLQKQYNDRLELVKSADLILTISNASKSDIESFMKIDPKKIEVVYASTDEALYTNTRSGNELRVLNEELGLTKPFIYSLTGYDPRKNNKGLIQAFSEVIKSNHLIKLIISGIKNEQEKEELYKFAIEHDVNRDRIMFLGFVSRECLLSLYKECNVFIFPSLYEGFGLPVLEAMRVGAPVISTNSSSIVEVAEEAAILVDPYDFIELAKSIEIMLNDEELSQRYSQLGIEQSQKFSWEEITKISLNKFETMLSISSSSSSNEKPVLAFFSPLNPQASGISDYSEELLVSLKNHFEIIIYVNGIVPSNDFINTNFDVRDINLFDNGLDNIKFRLYHIGNNELHDWIYKTLKLYPGVVLLHDLNLYGLFMYTTYLRGLKKQFVNELNYNYGEKGLEAAKQLIDNGTYPDSQQFPLYNKVVDLSTNVIVHSDWIKKALSLNTNFIGQVEVIPQGCILEDEVAIMNKADVKAKLNINSSKFIIGVFGHVIPNKRVDTIIKSFARLLKTNPDSELYIVGHAEIEIKQELSKLSKQLKADKSIKFIESPDIDVFKEYIKSCDLCINLRWPTMGETSATLTRALGYGIPCIVSNVGSYTEYPDDIVWKVDVDNFEEDLLLAYLLELSNNVSLSYEMSQIAKKYMKDNHSFQNVAKRMYRTINI
ncbi:glycosyltransferase [Paenibacillus sp. PL91]|uniref:glycosyltransferase n=1 Tax=Paenibacillus sp. PL91 TaxID=2729538 RepID=UPI00145E3F37|nr:glycosyltransferase [Paenibacillus sp. PL91]MBC9200435.1 glycosyltransferase [Paenibacillus sp. PL91]